MIPLASAEVAIAIARGLIKLGQRLDRLLAEKVATQSGLALKLPAVEFSIGPNRILIELQKYFDATSDAAPGTVGSRRKELGRLLKSAAPDPDALREFYALLFPDAALSVKIDPDEDYLKFLREALPATSLDDDDTRKAAFYAAAFSVDPGDDKRQLGYPLRIGLLVVDVLAEFGAEHTQLFVRDEGLRAVVQAVLTRFAKPELESFDTWSPLLRHALNATLNGALDAKDAWKGDNLWLNALLDALAGAREAAGDKGDDYLFGLLQGKGYHLLISQGLAQAAEVLNEDDADTFKQIAADVLAEAAKLVAAKPTSFGVFFKESWADLLHAGLQSLDKHGPVLLQGQDPLLGQVLLATMQALADTPGTRLITRETLFHVADNVVGAIATHPELVKGGVNEQWLAAVINSVAKTASNTGIRDTFTKHGLAIILRDAAATLGAHPELIVSDPGIFQNVVGGILTELGTLEAFDAATIAGAATQGALGAIAARPDLLKTKYAEVIADFAGQLAAKVKAQSLSALQASEIISAAAAAALRHPKLYSDASNNVAGIIVSAVLRAANDDPAALLNGEATVALVQEVLLAFARCGEAKVQLLSSQLEDQLVTVLKAGLVRADEELGVRLDLSTLPKVLARLVASWLGNLVSVLDPNDSSFRKQFAEIADSIPA